MFLHFQHHAWCLPYPVLDLQSTMLRLSLYIILDTPQSCSKRGCWCTRLSKLTVCFILILDWFVALYTQFSGAITSINIQMYSTQMTDLPFWIWSVGFASNMPFDSARYYAVTAIRGLVWDAINYVTAMRKESRQKLLKFQDNPPVSGGVGLGKGMPSSIQSTVECIRAFKDENWPS